MKTFVLVSAILKGFIRNYRSVLLIIVVPLLIVMSIFLAFSQEGIKGISVGYSLEEESDLDILLIENSLKTFTDVNRYYNHNACMNALNAYDEYVCIRLKGTGPYVIDIFYDNTREPIIWEILERLNQAFLFAQQKYSREMTESYLSAGKSFADQINLYDSELENLKGKINDARRDISSEQSNLNSVRTNLGTTLSDMERDIVETRALNTKIRRQVNDIQSETQSASNNIITEINNIPIPPENSSYKTQAVNQVYSLQSEVNSQVYLARSEVDNQDRKLDSYSIKLQEGRRIHSDLGLLNNRLNNMISQLNQYSGDIQATQNQLRLSGAQANEFSLANPDNIVRPIRTENVPTYVPQFSDDEIARWADNLNQEEQFMRGISLISLQTIFPSILMLITMFLSLLISTYITLSSINSKTYIRLKLVRGVTLSHYFSLIISSFLVILMPVSVVILIGGMFFRLHIMAQFIAVISAISLLSLIIIIVGMIVALLIKKESIALTTSTFILIIMIFYSGFLLPVERMSDGFSFIAVNSPGTLANMVFKQAVFYNVVAYDEITILFFQFLFLLIAAFLVRKYNS